MESTPSTDLHHIYGWHQNKLLVSVSYSSGKTLRNR